MFEINPLITGNQAPMQDESWAVFDVEKTPVETTIMKSPRGKINHYIFSTKSKN